MKNTTKMFTHRLPEELHSTARVISKRLVKTAGHRFPIVLPNQLAKIELLEFNGAPLFLGFNTFEAAAYIKEHTPYE